MSGDRACHSPSQVSSLLVRSKVHSRHIRCRQTRRPACGRIRSSRLARGDCVRSIGEAGKRVGTQGIRGRCGCCGSRSAVRCDPRNTNTGDSATDRERLRGKTRRSIRSANRNCPTRRREGIARLARRYCVRAIREPGVNEYAPEAFAVTVAVAAPVNCTVAPLPPVPLMVPLIVNVSVAKFAVAFALLIVTAALAGVKLKPVLLGVTV